MPDERLITELESILQQVVELGAEKERTRLGPNLLVTNAAPSGLANYVLVKDDRDGDNILALKVPSVVYNNNDLVNVLFVRGGEAIAFQQGSSSSSSGIWGIVAGTSTDIYYNSGDVGIGKAVAPDARLEILDTTQAQLRLTYQEDTDYVEFTVDTNADLLIKPSLTGQIKLQPTTDSTDFFQVLDADGGTSVLNVDSVNERVGIGRDAPGFTLDVFSSSASLVSFRVEDALVASLVSPFSLTHSLSAGTAAAGLGAQFRFFLESDNGTIRTTGGLASVLSDATDATMSAYMSFRVRDSGSVVEQMRLDSNGFLGINGITSPSTALDVGDGAIEFEEMTAPAAGAANTARLFARDDGDGDTELCVRFNSGLVQVISPLEFGEISRQGNAVATTITVAGTAVQYDRFNTNGPANGATPDHTTDDITINKTGTYMIVCSLSVESVGGSAAKFRFTVEKNNGATLVGALSIGVQMGTGGGDETSVSLSGVADLDTGDTVELWVANETNTQNILIEDAILSLSMIGVSS